METYENSYDKNEDFMLWELHEIRHELHKEILTKKVDEINREAYELLEQWKKRYNIDQAA